VTSSGTNVGERPVRTVLVVGGAGYIGSHAARALRRQGFNVLIYDNLSTGHRFLAKDFELTVKEVTQKPVRYKMVPRRPGDPPSLVADPSRAQQLLRWAPSRSLHDIVATAWKWKQRYEASAAK
jgi:UDP-glucose 4-epimerase